MGLSRAFPRKRSGVSCTLTSSNPGAITSGSHPRSFVMNTLPPSFVDWLTCTHARFSVGEMVLCLDERTNLQPRPRLAPTLAARPALLTRLEHEDQRKGALHGCAACDTRTGKVYARTATRKRQVDFIAFLSQLEREMPKTKTQVHLMLDNLPVHKGKQVQAWFAVHPRLMCHFVSVHCSWMNQVGNGRVTCKESAYASATSLTWITWHSESWPLSRNGMRKRTRSTG
jgi:transposase